MSLLIAWVYLRVNTTLCCACRVPVAIREHLRETLENLERREIIAGVTYAHPLDQLDGCRSKEEWQITHMFGSDGS